jgi:hypothetical protein
VQFTIDRGILHLGAESVALASIESLSVQRKRWPIFGFWLAGTFGAIAYVCFSLGFNIAAVVTGLFATGGLGMLIGRVYLVINLASGRTIGIEGNRRALNEAMNAIIAAMHDLEGGGFLQVINDPVPITPDSKGVGSLRAIGEPEPTKNQGLTWRMTLIIIAAILVLVIAALLSR